MESPKVRVAIFPSAGMGHLIPAAEFAKRLAGSHGVSVTFITCKWMFSPCLMAAYSQRIVSSGLDITFVQLPEVEIEGAEHMKIEAWVTKLLEESKGSIESSLGSLVDSDASPVFAFITDFFCSTMYEVVTDLCMPTYSFFTGSASLLSILLSIPKLVSEILKSFKDAEIPIEVPGLLPIAGTDLPTQL